MLESSPNLPVVLVGAVNCDLPLFWSWGGRGTQESHFMTLFRICPVGNKRNVLWQTNCLPISIVPFFLMNKVPLFFCFLAWVCSQLKIPISSHCPGTTDAHLQPMWYKWKSAVWGFWNIIVLMKGVTVSWQVNFALTSLPSAGNYVRKPLFSYATVCELLLHSEGHGPNGYGPFPTLGLHIEKVSLRKWSPSTEKRVKRPITSPDFQVSCV